MILDFHTHVFPPDVIAHRQDYVSRDAAFAMLYGDPAARLVDAEGLIRAMDEEGVEKAVICGFPWQDTGLCRRANSYLLDAQRRWPRRLLAFYTPSLSGGGDEVDRAADLLSQGMKGIGEVAFYTSRMGAEHWSFLDQLAGLALDRQVPFLLHVNESVGHAYPGKMDIRLKDLYGFVTRHQALTLVLAHWGGGFFFYELMKSVKKTVGRLYYDTAASPFLYAPDIYRIAVEILGPDRILFGSDYPLIRPSRYLKELDKVGLAPEDKRAILGDNALKLFNLDG